MAARTAKTDRKIQQRMLRELRSSDWPRDAEVGVEVDRGIVALTGTVASMEKKVAAEQAATGRRESSDVADDIELKYPGSHARTDAEIARAERRLLPRIAGIGDRSIRTTVSDDAFGWKVPTRPQLGRLRPRRPPAASRSSGIVNCFTIA